VLTENCEQSSNVLLFVTKMSNHSVTLRHTPEERIPKQATVEGNMTLYTLTHFSRSTRAGIK